MPGSVRKRGNSWQASVEVPRRNGKRERIYDSFSSEKEANVWIAERHLSVAGGTFVPSSPMTFSEGLAEWFATSRNALSTSQMHKSFTQRMESEFGSIALQRITLPMLERFVASLPTAKRLDGRAGELSEVTVDHHVRILKSFFKWAKGRRHIAIDVSAEIRRTRPQPGEGMTILTIAELKTMLRAAQETDMEAPVALAGLAGLRRGEALGIRWPDVDFDRGTVRVERSLTRTPKGVRLGSTKTNWSRRTLKLSPDAVHALARVRDRQVKELGSPAEFVCSTVDGRRWHPEVFGEHFRHMLMAGGFRRMRFHDLRHTHASQLIAAGVHIKVISTRLGHKNIQITMDLYGHLLPGVEDGAVVQLQALFEAA